MTEHECPACRALHKVHTPLLDARGRAELERDAKREARETEDKKPDREGKPLAWIAVDDYDKLRARLQFLIDFIDEHGYLPEHSFTFPDGEIWRANHGTAD